jgi:branched-subunit amino acid aminotransferase/4-amino-4-deoxychorismate lyase
LRRITHFTPWRGVFETLRVIEGQAEFVEEHWRSLLRAVAALKLPKPLDFRQRLALLPKKTGRWRWVVTDAGSEDSFQEQALDTNPFYTLSLSKIRLGSANWDTRFKTLSYLAHAQARTSVKTDEALVLNEREEMIGGAMSNLFWEKDGVLFTPSLKTGCRPGVMRGEYIRTQRRKKIQVREVEAKPEVLNQADALYLTNSWIGIRPCRWRKG